MSDGPKITKLADFIVEKPVAKLAVAELYPGNSMQIPDTSEIIDVHHDSGRTYVTYMYLTQV